jgi:hydroxyacyl-ACP dehydratase HTD2-like protein with hotdog domain
MKRPDSWADARRSVEALIGSLAWDEVEAEVREADITRFHEAIGMHPPKRAADGTMTGPALFLPPVAFGGEIGVDGRRRRPGEVAIDHPAFRRRLMGGCEVSFAAPIRAGETIRATTRFDSVVEKQGSDGPMLLVTTATEFRSSSGELKRVERWTIVHR